MATFTKKAILDTFVQLLNETPLDKITVTDIVNRCAISRNTFYYYYQDIYVLVDELFRLETEKIVLSTERKNENWADSFLRATRFARENKQAFSHIYHSVSRAHLDAYLYEVTSISMRNFVLQEAQGLRVSQEDIAAISEFYTAALVMMLLRWLDSDMRYDEQTYIRHMEKLLNGNIRLTLSRQDPRYQNLPIP